MKNTILLITFSSFILSSHISIAQQNRIEETIGKPYKKRARGLGFFHDFNYSFEYKNKTYILAEQEEVGYFYYIVFATYMETANDLFIYTVDDSMNVTERRNLNPVTGFQNYNITYNKYKLCGNRFLVFWEAINLRHKRKEFFCTSYNLENWKSETKWLNFSLTDEKSTFIPIINSNSNQFTVVKETPNKKNSKYTTWQISTYSNMLDLLSSSEPIELDLTEQKIENSQVANNNDLFILTSKVYINKFEQKTKTYKLIIVRDNEPLTIDLSSKDETTMAIDINVNVDNDTIVEVARVNNNFFSGINASLTVYNRINGKIIIQNNPIDLTTPKYPVEKETPKNVVKLDYGSPVIKSIILKRNTDGTYIVFMEYYHYWSQYLTKHSTKDYTFGGVATTQTIHTTYTQFHHIFGPGVITHIDLKSNKSKSTYVTYSKELIDFNPTNYFKPKKLDTSAYLLLSEDSYAIASFKNPEVTINSLKNNKRKKGFMVWTDLIESDKKLIQAYRKGRKLRFSTLKVRDN